MITEYIGSIETFLDCSKVAFCFIKSTVSLTLADISSYTIDNSYIFELPPKLVSKEYQVGFDEPVFQCRFTDEDKLNNYDVNYLIMYDEINNPIGFINLQQDILIREYDVDTITLEFNYDYNTVSTQLLLDITYTPHELKTKENLAHRILFDDKIGEKTAIDRGELESVEPKVSKFSRNLININRNRNYLFRYSGYLSRDFMYCKDNDYRIPVELLKDESNQEVYSVTGLLQVEGKTFIVLWRREDSKLVNAETGEIINLNFQIVTPFHIANNFIVETTYKKSGEIVNRYQYIHLTKTIINNYVENTRVSAAQMSRTSDFDGEDLVLNNEFRICKDPFKNELMIYRRWSGNTTYLSDYLQKIVDDFGSFNLGGKEIIYASKGFLILGTYNTECFELSKVQIFNYNLHGEIAKGILNPDYHVSEEELKVITNSDNTGILDSLEVDFIVPITSDLVLVQSKGQDYLLEANLDDSIDSYSVKLKPYKFLGHYKYKNLGMIAKDYVTNFRDIKLGYFTLDRNLYKMVRTETQIILSRL